MTLSLRTSAKPFDTAERPQEIDRARAERARDRAERRLAGRTDEEVDYVRALEALARALARIITAGRTFR